MIDKIFFVPLLAIILPFLFSIGVIIVESPQPDDLGSIHDILVGTVGETVYPIPELDKEIGYLTNFVKSSKKHFILQGDRGVFLYDGSSINRFEEGVILGYLQDRLVYWDSSINKLIARHTRSSRTHSARFINFDLSQYTHALTIYPRANELPHAIILFSTSESQCLESHAMLQFGLFGLYIKHVHPRYVSALTEAYMRKKITLFSEKGNVTHEVFPDIVKLCEH